MGAAVAAAPLSGPAPPPARRPPRGDRRRRDDPLGEFSDRLSAIAALEPELRRLDEGSLRRRVRALERRARAGEPLAELSVEGFALAREAARRTLGMRPYDVQMAGGLALFEGRVVEMMTGEGKTLAAVAPVFLHSLSGRGAHVLTSNDYLARRDAQWMGPAYRLLGRSVGCVQEGTGAAARRGAYGRDVTYLTAREAGFDHLRDGLALECAAQVQRPFHFALVDEADSILIDEARIPLVIAGTAELETPALGRLASLARRLEPRSDFDTDAYGHNIFLTEAGVERVETSLGCGGLFAPRNLNLLAAVRNALHAEHLLRRDVDYIVRRGAVELVDELTGRVADRRQWPDGLQAAVEAKEGLRLGDDGAILGAVTLQHLLGLYPRLCGMTATALGAAAELREIYGLEVAVVPPHEPCVRIDHPDRIYAGAAARDRAVLEEIERVHGTGRPLLVGTTSVAASERLAAALRRRAIPCRVLNARHDEEEAAIVAEAGTLGAVTVSTNMAGRGTDIRLGGPDERDRGRVAALGGLYVLGTCRHESRRIDRQLRGRAGRQGDPGSSRFFISLEDDLLRRYGVETLIPRRLRSLAEDPDPGAPPIESRALRREVERTQRIVEGECFDVRKRLYEYSEIVEKQRRLIREWRQEVLEGHAALGLLAARGGARWRELRDRLGPGPAALHDVERRLTLLAIDRCWSEHLTELQATRDEMHLVTLDGRKPLVEFCRIALSAYEQLLERIDAEVLRTFRGLEIGPEGIDWERQGLRGPSATWTYLVSDQIFGRNVLLGLANSASLGLGAILAYPVLFLWGLWLHWRRRRIRRRGR